jgi:predicted RNA binding protein YcfA (HicA-like mRNA interferase family)
LGKLKTVSGKALCKLLEEHGFVQMRQRGSHIVMQKRMDDSTITVPVPNHKQLKTGTLLSIIRQSQLPKNLFES